jgi:hypothetical protein
VAAVKGPKRMVVYQESRHSVGNVPAAWFWMTLPMAA